MAPVRWVFITGTDSGFGNMAAKMIAARGFQVFAAHLLPASAGDLGAADSKIVPVQVDITQQDSVDAAVKLVKDRLGSDGADAQLYGLVNNAGLMFRAGPVEWTPAENFEKMFSVNVVGASRVTNGFLPLLRKSRGRIVNVASMGGWVSTPSQVAYSATKFAMEGYSDGLRREMYDWGVSVHIVEPGVFAQTGLYATYNDGVQQLWNGISEEVQADYGADFRDRYSKVVTDALTQYTNADISVVPKAMIHALTASRPKYRYRVGPDSKFMCNVFNWVHESWQDWILQKAGDMGGRMLAAKMDPKARLVSQRRYTDKGGRRFVLLALLLYALLKIRRAL